MKQTTLFVAGLLLASLTSIQATPAVLAQELYTENAWKTVETTEDGITIDEKVISGVSVKAVKVSQILSVDPNILADVIEDVANYKYFLNSASGLECDLLGKTDTELVGYQYVNIPLISDRVYAFKMYRPDTSGTRVDWELIPRGDLGAYEINERSGVYIEYGVGSWSMNDIGNGKYEVSYRLVMDPGGWIPNSVSDYFNRVSIVGIFKDAIIEANKRDINGRG